MRSIFRYFAYILLAVFALMASPSVAKDKFVVVIDPGHGGNDIGTSKRHGTMHEKAIALNVALRLGRLIEKNHNDVKVVYTRRTDVYPTLPERVQKAKEAKGDLFISIHVNACPDASARGFETYVFGVDGSDGSRRRVEERLVEERENLDANGKKINFDTDIDIETKILCQAQREKHNKQSLEVARAVQDALISSLRRTTYAANVNNRGVKSKNLFVLCFSPMPAILVELGYMSNRAEERFINTDEAQSTFANAIYTGFKKYKSNWDRRQLNNKDNNQNNDNNQNDSQTNNQDDHQNNNQRNNQNNRNNNTNNNQNNSNQRNNVGNTPTASQQVIWKIQFLTSDRLLPAGSREFKGLSPVGHYKEGKIYKYTYGSASSTQQLSAEMRRVRAQFPSAFFVKFDKNGNRIQ